MTIITGSDKSHRGCVQNLRCSCRGFGYRFLVYDYDGTDHDIPFPIDFESYKKHGKVDYAPKLSHKPWVIYDALNRANDYCYCYCDADVEFLSPIPEVGKADFDIGVTAHPAPLVKEWPKYHMYPEMSAYLNAGVIFFKKSPETLRFIRVWMKEVKQCGTRSDQHALTNLVRRAFGLQQWYMGDVKVVAGARVKLFDSTIYNYVPRYKLLNVFPKIIHHIGQKVCVDS